MASSTSEDENSDDNNSITSTRSNFSVACSESQESKPNVELIEPKNQRNLLHILRNRELTGSLSTGPTNKTDNFFGRINPKCRYLLQSILEDIQHLGLIFMGFTLCGQYVLAYTETRCNTNRVPLNVLYETKMYELYIFKFRPGKKMSLVATHRIFNHSDVQVLYGLEQVMFMQFPNDMSKVLCYGYDINNSDLFYMTMLTLPSPNNCIHCHGPPQAEDAHRGWCSKHGFIVHFMFGTTRPAPMFDPTTSLSFPDHLVINTGHHLHILHVSTSVPVNQAPPIPNLMKDEEKLVIPQNFFIDDMSDQISESASDHFSYSSVIDAILEDFSEYDLESCEGKPFHELNISCEPLNVTGKNYHNALVQNICDPRLKRLQNSSKEYVFSIPHSSSQKPPEKIKTVDIKVAEKAYEFTEENDKYEKISLFRKKRLADKKYEFSEDNTENIVPFHILRRERRYLYRSRGIRSPDSLFLSPKSTGWRSPIQSPSSRSTGQFSPGGARHIYCTTVRNNSPYQISKSPISPRDPSTRKVNVYSPTLTNDHADCSDFNSRLKSNNTSQMNIDSRSNQTGLLIVDQKPERPKWIKKIVRRYSNGDFENSSLVSGQSRDDYNNPIEVPLVVQGTNEQQFDCIPEGKMDHITERQIIVTQRSLDCEQLFQRQAQEICTEFNLQFMYCEDYDIRRLHVCPINGEILCQAVIKIGVTKTMESATEAIQKYWTHFVFVWNIITDAFKVFVEPNSKRRLFSAKEQIDIPTTPNVTCNQAWVLDYGVPNESKTSLRDSKNNFEIYKGENHNSRVNFYYSEW